MEPDAPVILASPPRPITARVRRRAWMESGVRLWWVCAVATFVAAAAVLTIEVVNWIEQKKLFQNSVLVDAQAYETNGLQLAGRNLLIEGAVFEVRYTHQGKLYSVEGPLEGLSGHIISGKVFQIRIDPDSPERWTARITPPSFALRWLGPGITFLPALPLLLIAMIKRSRVISLFQNGQQHTAAVVNTANTPLAPLCHVVRCALLDNDDRRVIQVLQPTRYGKPVKGDEIELIVDPQNIVRAIAAAAYAGSMERETGH